MSGSPKCTPVTLTAEQQRRIAETQRQAEAADRARVALELAMQQEAERRARAHSQAREWEAVAHFVDLPSEITPYADQPAIQSIRDQSVQWISTLANDTADTTIASGRAALGTAEQIARDIHTLAQNRKFGADLDAESASLAQLQESLSGIDVADSEKFDAAGRRQVNGHIDNARHALSEQQLDNVRIACGEGQASLKRHRQTVFDRKRAWEVRRQEAQTQLDALRHAVAATSSLKIVTRWQKAEVAALAQDVADLENFITEEEFEKVGASASAIGERITAMETAAAAQELQEQQRQHIVQGTIQVLSDLGFVIDAAPALSDAANEASDILIQADRLGGGALGISIPQQGDIWFTVDDAALSIQTDATGQTVASCDRAEEQLAQLQEILEQNFGVVTGELMWEGKDPLHRLKSEKERPRTAQGSRDISH